MEMTDMENRLRETRFATSLENSLRGPEFTTLPQALLQLKDADILLKRKKKYILDDNMLTIS